MIAHLRMVLFHVSKRAVQALFLAGEQHKANRPSRPHPGAKNRLRCPQHAGRAGPIIRGAFGKIPGIQMCPHNQHLLRIFAPTNLSHHVRRFHRAIRKCVLYVEAYSHFFPARHVAFQLPLILGGHRHHWNCKIHVKSENPGVRQVHSRSLRSGLPPNHRDGSSLPGRFQEISKDCKQCIPDPLGNTLHHHQHNLTGKPRSVLDLFIDIEEIRRHYVAFRSIGRRRPRPAHRIHVQRSANRLQHFRLRRAARPSAPKLVIFRVHIFESHGLHLGHAPLLGFSLRRRSCHTRTNVVAQLCEVLKRVRIHHSFARNLHQRWLSAIFIRPLGCPVVRSRCASSAQSKSQHHYHSRQDTPHPLSPRALRAHKLYHALRRPGRQSVLSNFLCAPQRTLRLCVILSLLDPSSLCEWCISSNAITAISLPTSLPALNCLRGYLATPSQLPFTRAHIYRIFSSVLIRYCSFASAASSAKACCRIGKKSHTPCRAPKPRSIRAPRNQIPIRG